MTSYDSKAGSERMRRFRDAALPCLNDTYRLAFFLMRNRQDAENAVQECYLRARLHFGSWRGNAVRPWLLSILRNVCQAELARRGRHLTPAGSGGGHANQEAEAQLDVALLDGEEGAAMRQAVNLLPPPLREAIVMREIIDMPYREIAEVAGVPIGTVMLRLARAREMLLTGWQPRGEAAQKPGAPKSRSNGVPEASSCRC